MWIKDVKEAQRLQVLYRLLKKNEKFEDACSKSGLSIDNVRSILLGDK